MFYLFYHIMKTAGTSVRGELPKLFHIREDHRKGISREEVTVTRSTVTAPASVRFSDSSIAEFRCCQIAIRKSPTMRRPSPMRPMMPFARVR